MSKRLITATAGLAFGALALGMLATAAEARPHEGYYGSRYSNNSYSNDDGGYERRRTYRGHAGKRSGKRYAAKSGKQRSYARRGGSSRSASAGSSRGCLTPAARALLGRIEAQFGAMQIISTCRPGARIAGSGRSKHASGNAVDFNAGGRKGAVVRWLIANHKSGGTMTYSGMSHIHVDIGPRFVSLGARGG
jgi:Peptidase M15